MKCIMHFPLEKKKGLYLLRGHFNFTLQLNIVSMKMGQTFQSCIHVTLFVIFMKMCCLR